MAVSKKKPQHYVDNKKFLQALKDYKQDCIKAKKAKQDKPRIPEYIGESLLKIGTHLSYKPNSINYTYRDDMILDGVENCIQYIHNFDPDKSGNPFSYFTQIIFYAFLRRIKKEKKQTYVKQKLIAEMDVDAFMEAGEDGEGTNQYIEYMKKNQQLDPYFEAKEKKKQEKKSTPLSDAMDENNE